ncbi:MAG: nitroreductase family protein [Chloroflexi bacterium]|nr:nitroreductase family protein [Chloroflexota bacterium]
MDVLEAVRTLLAVRQFAEKPVPEATVRQIVEAAHLTASSMNKQPWHFVVVQDRDTLRKLGELARTGPYIAQASVAVVVSVEKDSPFGVSDGSRAIQDMMLVAWSEGVGSNWVGFGGLDEVGALVGVPPQMDVLAIVPFGYPAQPLGQGKKKRKPLAATVSRERFGEPFA